MNNTFQFRNFPYVKNATSPTEWEMWLHNGIDAQDAAILHGENPWESREALLARKSAPLPVQKEITQAMLMGREMKPLAKKAYKDLSGLQNLEAANIENCEHPWMLAHPSLMRGYHIADVHCGEAAIRRAAKYDGVPKPYWAEAQHTLMVTGYRKMAVYIHSPLRDLASKSFEVHASAGFQKELLAEEIAFKNEIDRARAAGIVTMTTNVEAVALDATIRALKGTGPKVEYSTYKKFVPEFATKSGDLTEKGKALLAHV